MSMRSRPCTLERRAKATVICLVCLGLFLCAGCTEVAAAQTTLPADTEPGAATTSAQPASVSARTPLAFTHVTVIDATGAPAQPDMTVLVVGDRIESIGNTGEVKVPAEAQTVDATGKFLIPGLWDMHAHITAQKPHLQLYVANGVTGIRHMHGTMFNSTNVLQWRREASTDGMIIPRLVLGSTIVDGPKPMHPGSISVVNEAQARQVVATVQKEGWDFVKVYFGLSRESYLALLDEAKQRGIPVAGHLPRGIMASEASRAGQKCIEHLDLAIFLECSAQEAELVKEGASISTQDGSMLIVGKALASYSDSKAAALFAGFAANGTWWCPTIVLHRTMLSDTKELLNDSRLRFMPPAEVNAWRDSAAKQAPMPQILREYVRSVYQRGLSAVMVAARRAGAGLLAGTDTPNPFLVPGFSLHDEIGLLVQAGLTPMEALQAATRNAAKFNGTLASLGTIEKGKLADLVLLDANPLENIGNTLKIRAVVADGRLLDRNALDELLARVERLAKRGGAER